MRLLRAAFLPTSVLLLAIAAMIVPLPFFLERPGTPLGLEERVTVEYEQVGDIAGDFLLTTVVLQRTTAVELPRGLLSDRTELVPAVTVIGPGESDSEYFARQREVFREAALVAAAVGLRAAGFDIPTPEGEGARVVGVLADAPAEGVLRPGDVVVATDAGQVSTTEDLRTAVFDRGTEALELTFLRDGQRRTATLTPTRIAGVDEPVVGVQIETLAPPVELPFNVEVDSGSIGGPSAGLMLALTVFDKVDELDLAAGRRIAGTGGITPEGGVTPIGGIEQKVSSAAGQDLDVFLAPAMQMPDACAGLPEGAGLQVLGVETFDEAVEVLSGDAPGLRCEGQASAAAAT